MKTNRLVVTLNKAMQTSIERGLNQIYANSNLVNEFVVRPSFLLQDGQSMWVTFKNAETNATVTLKPTLLAERRATKDVILEVDNDVAQLPQEASAGCEYYTALPAEITGSASKWYFSIKICQIPQGEDYSDEDVVKQTQTKTGDVNYFTVYNSLAGAGPSGDAPSELDVVALYNTAIYAKGEAEQSAQDAESYAQQAQQAAQDVNASNYAPYVGEDGKWYQYSKQEQRYVDTGVTAQGPQGLQGERGLQGEKGDKGEKGEKGDRGEQGPAVDTSKLVTTDTDQTIISGKTIILPAESAFAISNADGAMLSVNTLAGERAIDIDREGVGDIPLRFNSDGGTEGQVLTSMGAGKTPQWRDVPQSSAVNKLYRHSLILRDAVSASANTSNTFVCAELFNSDSNEYTDPWEVVEKLTSRISAHGVVKSSTTTSNSVFTVVFIEPTDATVVPKINLGSIITNVNSGATTYSSKPFTIYYISDSVTEIG